MNHADHTLTADADADADAPVTSPERGPASARSLTQEIRRLMTDFSVEATPVELARLGSMPADLAPGSQVYIPWTPNVRFEHMLRAAVRLRELGMTPVPHLVVRAIADVAALDKMLAQLRREAAVDHALLVAGSQRQPVGVFDSALTALSTGMFERHGWRSIGLAAHPEGSPDIAPQALARALRDKNAFAACVASATSATSAACTAAAAASTACAAATVSTASTATATTTTTAACTALQLHLVTQFSFAASPIIEWERRARTAGNLLSVHVGLAGLASLPRLLHYARICGVGASIGSLMRQSGRWLKLATALNPGEIVVALARSRLIDPASCIQRCHLFPFGGLDATVAWAAAVVAGDFKLLHDDTELLV